MIDPYRKDIKINFLDNFNIPYQSKLNMLSGKIIVRIKTSVFPYIYHSVHKHDDMYTILLATPNLIPSECDILIDSETNKILGFYVDCIHLNSKSIKGAPLSILQLGHMNNPHELCIGDFVNQPFIEKYYMDIFIGLFYRLKSWNHIDRQYDLEKGNIKKIRTSKYLNGKLYRDQRLAWIKNVLESRNQSFNEVLHY